MTDWTAVQRQSISEKIMVKVLDKNYERILVTSGEDDVAVAWLTSRLLLFPYSIGIIIAVFNRLREITCAATRTVSIFQEEFAVKEAAVHNMYLVHGTTCFNEILSVLSRYPQSIPLQTAGLSFLIVLLRPIHGENLSNSRLGLRKLINDSQAAKEIIIVASHHRNNYILIELLLKVCTNLDQYSMQKSYLLQNGIFSLVITTMRHHLECSSVQLAGLATLRNFLHDDFRTHDTDPYEILHAVVGICIDVCSLHYIYEHHKEGQGYLVDSTVMNLIQHLTLYSHHKILLDDERLKSLLQMIYDRYSDVDEMLQHNSSSVITMTLLAIDVMKRVTSG